MRADPDELVPVEVEAGRAGALAAEEARRWAAQVEADCLSCLAEVAFLR